jgi:hypothetical protein
LHQLFATGAKRNDFDFGQIETFKKENEKATCINSWCNAGLTGPLSH